MGRNEGEGVRGGQGTRAGGRQGSGRGKGGWGQGGPREGQGVGEGPGDQALSMQIRKAWGPGQGFRRGI